MMVIVDANVAFRCTLELDAWRGGCDLVDVEAACLFRSKGLSINNSVN
jgi:hypothetical protein